MSSEWVSTRQRQRTYVHRSSSRSTPDTVLCRAFSDDVQDHGLQPRPRGGLEPSSARRLWRANKPPSLAQHRSPRDRHLHRRPASRVHVHKLHPHYKGFPTTTSRSTDTPTQRYSTSCGFSRLRRSLSPSTSDSHVVACLPTFRAEAADQAHATSMPDTTWPINGLPPDSSRKNKNPRF